MKILKFLGIHPIYDIYDISAHLISRNVQFNLTPIWGISGISGSVISGQKLQFCFWFCWRHTVWLMPDRFHLFYNDFETTSVTLTILYRKITWHNRRKISRDWWDHTRNLENWAIMVISGQKTEDILKNCLDFLSRNDACSILRNWIFCPDFTDRGQRVFRMAQYDSR